MNEYQSRPVGLQERYSVSRTLSGIAPIICMVATLTTPISTSHLSDRITELLSHLPLLRSCITDVRSTSPKWIPIAPSPTYNDILHQQKDEAPNASTLLVDELRSFFSSVNLETGPLWRVTLSGRYLSLSVHHTISDGKGTLNLFRVLLSSSISWPHITGGIPTHILPPTSETTLKLSPPFTFLLPIVWRELVRPKLPLPTAKSKPFWPHAETKGTGPHSLQTFQLDGVTELKKVGKERGVPTLHGVLHAIFITALFEGEKMVVRSESPLNARVVEKHGLCTGNYVGAIDYDSTLTPSLDFWSMARSYSSHRTKQKALYEVGMLAYIPDSPPSRTDERTGWERFWDSKITYRHSITVSNLGYFEEQGVAQLVWTQPPYSGGLTIDLVGCREALNIAVGWREGKVTKLTVQRFIRTVQRIVTQLIEGQWKEGCTVKEVAGER